MALLHEAVDEKKFDSRVAQRNIERGLLKPEELKKHVESLPDDASHAVQVDLDNLLADDVG
jgi:hypothetical protein